MLHRDSARDQHHSEETLCNPGLSTHSYYDAVHHWVCWLRRRFLKLDDVPPQSNGRRKMIRERFPFPTFSPSISLNSRAPESTSVPPISCWDALKPHIRLVPVPKAPISSRQIMFWNLAYCPWHPLVCGWAPNHLLEMKRPPAWQNGAQERTLLWSRVAVRSCKRQRRSALPSWSMHGAYL
ncbi:hypothetical protein LX32DRAFT_110547 [Colletotrichum zoysiae]|uniref:Uncharacterized protein n=1 Tax=Colletotrichum zoysiae TaxID=1216348 RepID=A0AAD9M050_9PEZI|nr:hypothetical protein LX32DRAFT_110547 [Colletotrichum zoysiae]